MIGLLSLGKIWQQVLGNAAQSFMALPDRVLDEESLQKQKANHPQTWCFPFFLFLSKFLTIFSPTSQPNATKDHDREDCGAVAAGITGCGPGLTRMRLLQEIILGFGMYWIG
jgi:hypothetical protein